MNTKNSRRPSVRRWNYVFYFLILICYALVLLITLDPLENIHYSDVIGEIILLIQPVIWVFYVDPLIRSRGSYVLALIGLMVFSLAAVSDLMDEFVQVGDGLGWVEDAGLPIGLLLISPALIIEGRRRRAYVRFLEQRETAARETSLTDSLTNLSNRRFFEEYLSGILSNPYMYQGDISLVFIDLDNFKALNDTFGHQEGDAALRKLAEIISGSVRDKDVAARYGGDEFLILLEGTAPDAAAVIVERIRTRFAEFCRSKSRRLKRKISLSAGITQVGRFESFSDAVNRADRAMYRAKSDGKDGAAQL